MGDKHSRQIDTDIKQIVKNQLKLKLILAEKSGLIIILFSFVKKSRHFNDGISKENRKN